LLWNLNPTLLVSEAFFGLGLQQSHSMDFHSKRGQTAFWSSLSPWIVFFKAQRSPYISSLLIRRRVAASSPIPGKTPLRNFFQAFRDRQVRQFTVQQQDQA
jgi:hypothetical protein